MKRILMGIAVVCLTTIAVAAAIAQSPEAAKPGDWPSWRGPKSNGIAENTSFPPTWPVGVIAPVWQAAVAEGWSSPIVADGRVFITDRRAALERAAAFDAVSGKLLWERTSPVDFEPHSVGQRHGNGPKATPVYSEGRVYTLGIGGRLRCLAAADGAVVWEKYLPAEYGMLQPLPGGRTTVVGDDYVVVPTAPGQGAVVPLFGFTGSPLVVDQLLIVPVGGPRGGTIMAFDKATGIVAWQALRENVSYSSPVPATLGGVKQVVVATGPRVVGLELASGRLLWGFEYQNQYDETIGTPVVAGDKVLLSAVGRPLSAWRVVSSGGAFNVAEVWNNQDLESYLSSVVVVDGFVYGMNDGGEWHCLRLDDGRTVWRGGNRGFYSTPLVVDRRLLGLNEAGELMVLAVDPTGFRPLAINKIANEPTWTSPAAVGNRLYIRSRTALACFEIK